MQSLPTIETCNSPIKRLLPGPALPLNLPRLHICFQPVTVVSSFFTPPSPHRLPSAYRLLLAECVRRCGWSELYTGQATRLAEHMARVREKEVGRRELFHTQVERYLPQEVLQGAGLAEDPPRCGISLPQPSVPLLVVTVQVR